MSNLNQEIFAKNIILYYISSKLRKLQRGFLSGEIK